MIYADSSFFIRLLTKETTSANAVALYQRMNRPVLAFSSLHEIEVRNGLRQKVFVGKSALPAEKKPAVNRELAAWEARLSWFFRIGLFRPAHADWAGVIERALKLSTAHTLKLGTRAYDILHVAIALELGVRDFITSDLRQAALGKAAGLKVTVCE